MKKTVLLSILFLAFSASTVFAQSYNYHYHDRGNYPPNKYSLWGKALDEGRANLERRRALEAEMGQRRLDSDREYELRKQELELRRQEIELQRQIMERDAQKR